MVYSVYTRGLQRDVVYLCAINSALVYESKSGRGIAGSQPMSTVVHIM
jgi:hypothetical protein